MHFLMNKNHIDIKNIQIKVTHVFKILANTKPYFNDNTASEYKLDLSYIYAGGIYSKLTAFLKEFSFVSRPQGIVPVRV